MMMTSNLLGEGQTARKEAAVGKLCQSTSAAHRPGLTPVFVAATTTPPRRIGQLNDPAQPPAADRSVRPQEPRQEMLTQC